jgi:predicted nucleotidyltransferase
VGALQVRCEAYIRAAIARHLGQVPVFLFGSRARGVDAPSADFDLWIDADVPDSALARLREDLEESFVPYHVDWVQTRDLRGTFGEAVRREAVPWA